ncbi:hypothetical protein GS397_13455 [Sphingobium yanoikuyae]|uniref:Uncharacterized protein n=1 Tax=Sphingobium yanoikuyae TaxID=13690 RepID=A0A6P1GI96_SPHYA|nr:DUF6118 family protein [Sphingobium yanoikuyae]QHD67943.1 hypothetical protein GS397_13455 [Sphingobium yanoikuyae]
MDDDPSLLNDPDPRPNAAAEAFARLEARIAGIEERMERRMEMLTRAVEHVVIEKQSIEIPDYSATLARIGGTLATLTAQTKKIADAPAMELTPENMGERIKQAAAQAREADRATIQQSRELHSEAHADQMQAIGTIRTKEQQRLHLLYAVGGATLAVSLLWLIYPGWAAGIGPQGWLWPERVARRTLGEATLWDAGIHLMRAGNPDGWQALVDATDIRQANRDAIAACEMAAEKAKEPVRCTIKVGS